MGRLFQLPHHVARLLGQGGAIIALGVASVTPVCAAGAPGAASAAPAASASASTAATSAPLPADSPEMVVQSTLVEFLKKMEPKEYDTLTAEDYDRDQVNLRIKLYEQSGNADNLQDSYLYYLTKLPPDPKDYADVLSRLAWLLEQRDSDAGLLTLLFDVADHFPSSAKPVQQIRYVQSEYLLKTGGPQAALVVLQKLSSASDTLPDVRMLAAGRAGYLFESLGQTDDAIAQYEIAGSDLSAGAQANEALVRATFLQLELGKTDDALATIAKLAKVPDAVLKQSPAAPVIKQFVDLAADPAKARAYWAFQDKWQPLWDALEKRLGVEPSPDTASPLMAPYIDNYVQLAAQASVALTQHDAATYFSLNDRLFRSGRWLPDDLANAVSMLYKSIAIEGPFAKDILAFGAAVEQAAPQDEKDLLKQLVQARVAVLMDAPINQPADARDAARAALEKYGSDGAAGQALARLFALAVLQSNSYPKFGDEAATILADTLKDPAAHGDQRALAVAVLSELYSALQRENDAQKLIQSELANLNDANDPGSRFRNVLQTQLDNLRQRSMVGAGLNMGLSGWWTQHKLPWQDYVMLTPEAGPLSTVDDPAVQVARDFAQALDTKAPLTQRGGALEQAWDEYPDILLTGKAVVDSTNDFLGHQELPQDVRYFAWSRSVLHLFWTGQRAAAEKLLAVAPTGSDTAADDRADFNLWDDYLAQPYTVAAQQAFADKIFAQPAIRRPVLLLAVHLINTLANLNDLTAAKDVFDKLGKAPLDTDAKATLQGMQDSVGPLLDSSKALNPIADALRQVVLDAKPKEAAAAKLPEAWVALNDQWTPDLSLLTQDEMREGLLTVIRDRLPYGRHPLEVFLDYGESLTFDPADSALRMKLFETVQKLATRDEDRFYAALYTSVVDFDDPAVAAQGWKDLAPDQSKDFPKADNFVNYYATLMKWRTGGTIDPATAFGPFNSKTIDSFDLRLLVDYYLQQGDKAGLQKLMDARPEADFLASPVVAGYVKAARLLGQDDRLKRAAEAAQLELAKDVVESWARPDVETAMPVFELASALDDPKAYPRDWVAALLSTMRNENSLDLVKMEDGRLQHDWAGELSAADSYLQRNATSYDAYWRKAEALVNLGRPAEAVAPLRVYVKYSHNEDEYPRAAELLKQFESETTKAPGK